MDTPSHEYLPEPFTDLPPASQRLETFEAVGILETLIEDASGLATSLYAASLRELVDIPALSAALHMLAEHLTATLAIFRRWQRENPGLSGEA